MALSDRDRAALAAMRATLAAGISTIDAIVSRESAEPAPSDVITLEAATALLGSKRRAREAFAAFERAGFEVHRLGHAAFMARAEWDRAVAAQRPKRTAPSTPSAAANDGDDESPASILARSGLEPSRIPSHQPRTPKRRAA